MRTPRQRLRISRARGSTIDTGTARPFTWTIRSPFDRALDGDFVAPHGPSRRRRRAQAARSTSDHRPPTSSDVHAQYPAVECHFPLRSPFRRNSIVRRRPRDFQVARHPRRPSRRARPFHVRAGPFDVRWPIRRTGPTVPLGPAAEGRSFRTGRDARPPRRRCTPQSPRPLRGTDRRPKSPHRRAAARARPEIRCGNPPRRTAG